MKSAVNLDEHTVTDIEFQPASIDIWDAKYRLSAKDGRKIAAGFCVTRHELFVRDRS